MNLLLGDLHATAEKCFFCRIALHGLVSFTTETLQDETDVKSRYVFGQFDHDCKLTSLRIVGSVEYAPSITRLTLVESVARVGKFHIVPPLLLYRAWKGN